MKTSVLFSLCLSCLWAYPAQKDTLLLTEVEVKNQAIASIWLKDSSVWQNTPKVEDITAVFNRFTAVTMTTDSGLPMGYSKISIRGVDKNIPVYLDGVRLNDMESQTVYFVDMPDLLSSLESVAVVHLLADSLQDFAFGSSISLRAMRPKEKPYLQLEQSYGSYHTMRTSIALNTASKDWRLYARTSYMGSAGYRDYAQIQLWGYFAHLQSLHRKYPIGLKVFGGNEATGQAWLGISKQQLSENRRFNPMPYVYDSLGNVLGVYKNTQDHYTQHHAHLYTQYAHKNWRMFHTLHYTFGKGYYENYAQKLQSMDFALPLSIGLFDAVLQRYMQNHAFGALNQATFQHKQHKLHLNLYALSYFGQYFGNMPLANHLQVPLNSRYYHSDSFKQEVLSSVHWEYYAKPWWSLQTGVQYRFVHHQNKGTDKTPLQYIDFAKNYHFVSPKIGVLFYPNTQHKFTINYAFLSQEPSRMDYVDNIAGFLPKPENWHHLEMNYFWHTAHWFLKADIFALYYHNFLGYTGALNGYGDFLRSNFSDVYRVGAELELTFKWHDIFTMGAGALYLLAKFAKTGKPLSYAPPLIFSHQLSVQALKNWQISAHGKYIAPQYADNSGDTNYQFSGYYLANLDSHYKISFKKYLQYINLGVSVRNLFNHLYNSYAVVYAGDMYYFPQAGTQLYGTLSFGF